MDSSLSNKVELSLDMMKLHDNLLPMAQRSDTITVTERGQVSIPAALRKAMNLHRGRKLRWEQVSDRECRVFVEPETVPGPLAALGMGPQLRGDGKTRTTADWMREIREGEAE
jgi:AbrB family looped-hinge helix DNA binding protein